MVRHTDLKGVIVFTLEGVLDHTRTTKTIPHQCYRITFDNLFIVRGWVGHNRPIGHRREGRIDA